jgi:NADH:ubiquinone oxidoreductase subunit K
MRTPILEMFVILGAVVTFLATVLFAIGLYGLLFPDAKPSVVLETIIITKISITAMGWGLASLFVGLWGENKCQ